MDFTSALKPDIYRVVAVILIPGFIASFPWLGFFYWPELLSHSFWNASPIPGAISIFISSLLAGMIIEDIGAQIEVDRIDKPLASIEPDFEKVWLEYLRVPISHNLVATRYLSALVTRYKFELSMIPALGSAALALMLCLINGVGFEVFRTVGMIIFSVVLIDFMFKEAKQSGRVLHNVRLLIVEEFKKSKTI